MTEGYTNLSAAFCAHPTASALTYPVRIDSTITSFSPGIVSATVIGMALVFIAYFYAVRKLLRRPLQRSVRQLTTMAVETNGFDRKGNHQGAFELMDAIITEAISFTYEDMEGGIDGFLLALSTADIYLTQALVYRCPGLLRPRDADRYRTC